MRHSLIIRFCVVGIIVLFLVWLRNRVPLMEPGTSFAVVLLVGVGLGLLAVKFVLPRLGDAVGSFFFLPSGAVIPNDDCAKAEARLAQGDYHGAIEEYETLLREQPDHTLAIAEIAKIHAQKLHDPLAALRFLEAQLDSREWSQDNAAFLMFRMVDIHATVLKDVPGEQVLLARVIEKFPETRHSANAHHRLNELRKAQAKSHKAS